jgi:hypothetical protein
MQGKRNFFHKTIWPKNPHSWAMFCPWKPLRPELIQANRSVYVDIGFILMLHMMWFNSEKVSAIYYISLVN